VQFLNLGNAKGAKTNRETVFTTISRTGLGRKSLSFRADKIYAKTRYLEKSFIIGEELGFMVVGMERRYVLIGLIGYRG
jgi:hypothetical protein